METILPLCDGLSSNRNATVCSDPHKHADQVAHLNRNHRRRRDQRGGEGALFMHDLKRAGEDDSQKSCWDENANFKAESEDGAEEKKDNECHFQRLMKLLYPLS
jgi:hypothetical protein